MDLKQLSDAVLHRMIDREIGASVPITQEDYDQIVDFWRGQDGAIPGTQLILFGHPAVVDSSAEPLGLPE